MKKLNLLLLLIFAAFMSFSLNHVYASSVMPQKDANVVVKVNADELNGDESNIIKKIGLKNNFQRSPESQIRSFIKKYNRYSEKNDIENLKTMYTDDYVNNDGFNRNTIFKLMEEAFGTYKNVSYKTEIESIQVNDNYAVVKAHEIATGETVKNIKKIDDNGLITSDIHYTDYLTKVGNKWKISAGDVTYEKVELKYGEAKKVPVEIIAPECVPEGSEYDVSIKLNLPVGEGIFAVGSIVNDEIVYPQTQSKDVFRAIKYEELARILKSNTNKHNEYATVSIALSRTKYEPASLVLDLTGMAFVMKRVNVLSVNK